MNNFTNAMLLFYIFGALVLIAMMLLVLLARKR